MQENGPNRGPDASFFERLFQPVDIASIVFVRIAFGLIMMWEVWRYITYGWIAQYYIQPSFHFTYYGFSWIAPWPGVGMYYHFLAMAVLALCVACGFLYRITAALFFLAFTYIFLLDQARYLNHFYLVSLVSFVMIFIPAHWSFSLDSWRKPRLHSSTAPAWALWLLRIQVGIPYFFGGIAKLNSDWLQGEPMRLWLSYRDNYPFIGPYVHEEWVVYFFSYGGMLFDLLIIPCLLWRKTRPFAYALVLVFNLTNAFVFNIGIFPWFMIAATTIYFEPDWPRRILGGSRKDSDNYSPEKTGFIKKKVIASCLALYLFFQFAMPLRHHLYPGNVHWTEEGHRFSWRMKLRDKEGMAEFFVENLETGEREMIFPHHYLTRRQYRAMVNRPDMILQFAHYLAEVRRERPDQEIAVYTYVDVSLNGRDFQLMIDPQVNLAAQERNLWHASWILPLHEELRPFRQ